VTQLIFGTYSQFGDGFHSRARRQNHDLPMAQAVSLQRMDRDSLYQLDGA
jgi:hypothetical protein